MIVSIEVPASIGNVGPGFDVLGLAVGGLHDTILMERTEGASFVEMIKGCDAETIPMEAERNTVTLAAAAMAKILRANIAVKVTIARAIPASGGLGASAASSLEGALGVAALLGRKVLDEHIFMASLEAEAAVSGRHLDNLAPCLFGGLTIALGTEPPRAIRVPVDASWWVAVVTPAFRLETRVARGVLPESLPRTEWVRQMALSAATVTALRDGNRELLREVLHDPFAEPRRKALIPNFDLVKAAALSSGALGASISGAGPSVFAIFDDETSARRGRDAMARAFGETSLAHVGQVADRGATVKIMS